MGSKKGNGHLLETYPHFYLGAEFNLSVYVAYRARGLKGFDKEVRLCGGKYGNFPRFTKY